MQKRSEQSRINTVALASRIPEQRLFWLKLQATNEQCCNCTKSIGHLAVEGGQGWGVKCKHSMSYNSAITCGWNNGKTTNVFASLLYNRSSFLWFSLALNALHAVAIDFFSIWNTYIRLVVMAIQETNRASTHLNCIAVHRSRFCNRCCKTPASAFGSICKLALLVSLISETSGVWTCDYKRDTWLWLMDRSTLCLCLATRPLVSSYHHRPFGVRFPRIVAGDGWCFRLCWPGELS